jgi:glycosyltransferase involved in cell wall biosynthesis
MEVLGLKRQGYNVSVLAFCHIKFVLKRAMIRKVKRKYYEKGITIHIMPSCLIGSFLIEFFYYPIGLIVATYFIFAKNIKMFHVHGYEYSLFFLPFKAVTGIKVFCDIHGAVIEEHIYNTNAVKEGSPWHRYSNFKERLALRLSDINFCVSQNMIDYYVAKHNLSFNQFKLTRSSFDPDIFGIFDYTLKKQAKEKLGLRGELVLLYMGHKKAWQLTENVVNYFAYLKKYVTDLKLIFLSNEVKETDLALGKRNISGDDYLIKFVPHREVPIYSYAADMAIIIRDDSIINKVASPVKFSEYLASGTFVLTSPSIGDLAAIVRRHDIGFVLNRESVKDLPLFVRRIFSNEERKRLIAEKCREVGEENFSLERTLKTFTEAYRGGYCQSA